MKQKKLTAWILAMLLLTQTAGCAAGDAEETEPAESAAETQPAAETGTETEMTLELAMTQFDDRDYAGYTLRIADRAYADVNWTTLDVYAEELTGEVINDAVYNRNTALEDVMNIKVAEFRQDYPGTTIKQSVVAGTDDYDIVTDGLSALANLSTEGYLLDYRNIAAIDPEQTYWDWELYDGMSILGKSYFMTGDISMMDNQGTWCYVFNKDMITDYGLEDPYTLVREGTWTIDKHNEMAAAVTHDANGDGKWDGEDVYGLLSERYNSVALWTCMGNRIVEKDGDGKPYFSYDSEISLDALVKTIDTNYGDFSNLGTGSTVTGWNLEGENSMHVQFAAGKTLFRYLSMGYIITLRDSDVDFGVLPAPKANEEQNRYWSCYSAYNFTAYSIPATCHDAEKIGDIMEAMACFSLYTLTPAYYEQTLLGKAIRDQDSEEMIDLILRTRNFDLGLIFDFGGIFTAMMSANNSGSIASTLAAREAGAVTALNEFMEKVSDNMN